MEYVSIKEIALKWNMSKRRIQILCKEGRINDAKRVGNRWLLPKDIDRPNDARMKTPIYEKNNRTKKSDTRADLKKVLKVMYKEAEELGIKREVQRSYVLAAIAACIIRSYMAAEEQCDANLADYYKIVYSDLEAKENFNDTTCALLLSAKRFVCEHENKVDDIISWAYQYSNKLQTKSLYAKTQFFTEKYMIEFLLKNIDTIENAKKIVDPCCGGGNFLVRCYEMLCENINTEDYLHHLLKTVQLFYGYDIDSDITRIAIVNIKLKTLSLLKKHNEQIDMDIWGQIKPNVFSPVGENVLGTLSLGKEKVDVVNLITNRKSDVQTALSEADIVITNPPFETVKGMKEEMKYFLKKYYKNANSDMCASFLLVIKNILKKNGTCGIVTQNSWMFLNSFHELRKDFLQSYEIKWIANLGSGAFYDLSGEKSNVALMIFTRSNFSHMGKIKYLDLCGYGIEQKMKKLTENNELIRYFKQDELEERAIGFDFTSNEGLKKIYDISEKYASLAIPMQGTSTGNAKEFVDYFWNHFGDSEWKLVSKGGGYCRWKGLNHYVVKWGENGEYIKNTKGSALRNVKYFNKTEMVFSDTGTAGLNVRNILESQIFIASGPGIRIQSGKQYAQLAYLNSRIATFYIRILSPKLTISAGYIGKLPINKKIYNSTILENNAKLCIEQKQKFLKIRPTNYEFENGYLNDYQGNIENCAWNLFLYDIKNEVLKLKIESQIDMYICNCFAMSGDDKIILDERLGKCAYDMDGKGMIDYGKLDRYLAQHLDAGCVLKRSRVSKMAIGNDGIVEYTSKEFDLNPEYLIQKITENEKKFVQTIEKYKNFILHNEILKFMGYSTDRGLKYNKVSIDAVVDYLLSKYATGSDMKAWIINSFEVLHKSIFNGAPILIIKENSIVESR